MNEYSDNPILNDIFDDEPTDPFIKLTVVQRQLDSTESVVSQFTGRAQALGYKTEQPMSWMERLEAELEPEQEIFEEDILAFVEDSSEQ